MADRATIARPYARAAFAHAQDAKDLAGWSKLLGAAAKAAADPRVARLIGNPHVTGEELVELLGGLSKQAAGEGGRTSCARSRRTAGSRCCRRLRRSSSSSAPRSRAWSTSKSSRPREIAAPQEKKLAAALAKRLGREVRMHTRIDGTLLGGAIVRAGDLVIDGSLKGRLERLGSALQN